MIHLHDTRSNSLIVLEVDESRNITIYTCGPTVYSEPLVGNWVAYLRWDLLVRTLRANGLPVKRVMNITDVGHLTSDSDEGEDKMEKGARREGISAWDVAARYTNRFLEGMTALNLLPPEIMSKATEHIAEQIELIQTLEAKGHTYVIDDGVYFDTATFPAYADFAHLDLEAMRAGARVEVNGEKRNAHDFALWKFSPKTSIRDMEWDSPWGKGFPGWHIECSAMALKYLSETIDIHTGGIDHIPVHHTNEIAQSEAATGKQFARIWMHANFLLVNGTKISKSLDNGYTLADLERKGFSPLDFRMFVLQSHYRSESNFTWRNLEGARSRLNTWRAIATLRHQLHPTRDTEEVERIQQSQIGVLEALNHDLNSPLALTRIEEVWALLETSESLTISPEAFNAFIAFVDDALGLKLLDTTPDITYELKQIISEREQARHERNWSRSDELRDELFAQGIGLNDTPDGARWYYL